MIPAERACCFSSFNVGIFFQEGKKSVFSSFSLSSRGEKGILAEIPNAPYSKRIGNFGDFSKFCLIAYVNEILEMTLFSVEFEQGKTRSTCDRGCDRVRSG